MRVNARNAGLAATRAHSPGNGFVEGEGTAGTRVDTSDGEIVHGAGSRGGNAIGDGLRERAQQHVYDALRSLNVSARDRGRRPGIYDGSCGSDDFNGTHQPSRRRNIVREQTTEDVEACRIRNRRHRIYTALNLRIASSKIHGNRVRLPRTTALSTGRMNLHLHLDFNGPITNTIAVQKILSFVFAGR